MLLATVLASTMAFLDATAVNVALPAIGRDLGASLSGLQWIVTGYTLALASLVLLGGALGDRYGRRRVFLIGVIWFAAASILCGLAPTTELLIAARVLQGIGGALLAPGSLSLIQASFQPTDRARAIGLWSGLGGIAGLGGPFLGGFLVDAVSWRWIFLINIPLAIVVVAVSLRHVPESRDPTHHGRFDVLGAVLTAVALGGITYALIDAGSGPGTWVALAVGLAAGVGFIMQERRSDDPMLPLSIFTNRQFSGANLSTLAVYGALGAFSFFLVLQLQTCARLQRVAGRCGDDALDPRDLPVVRTRRCVGHPHRTSPADDRRAPDRRRPGCCTCRSRTLVPSGPAASFPARWCSAWAWPWSSRH
jgi:EmrB/QacA subfamily drug resistance transporter